MFEEGIQELLGKGGTSMCTVLDKVENRGKLEGMIEVYYTKLHYSAEQIAGELGTPVEQIQEIIRKLAK